MTSHDDLEKRPGAQNRLHDLYLAWNEPTEVTRFADNATDQPTPTP